ncbi:MAG: MOSC domain-containing protein [Enterobacterales bacterium]|nr:MOSC domain-containing protein [Enterobacterales bacterium]
MSTETENLAETIRLKSIHVYPIKSLAGNWCEKAQVEKQGVKGDRLFMLVDENGVFISQRIYPQLALLSVQTQQNKLIVKAKNGEHLTINRNDFTPTNQVFNLWREKVNAKLATAEVNQFFSDYLNKKVSLVQYDQQQPRTTDPRFSNADDIVSFADGFPLLLLNQASLDDLNQRLEKPVSMQNFRGNLIIEGAQAFAEDHWKKIRIGDIEFDLVKPCSRCVMTTVDPKTGIVSATTQPLKTLAKFRKTKQGIMFGINLIPRSLGKIKVGDKLEVTQFNN